MERRGGTAWDYPTEMKPILAHLNRIDVYSNPVGHHCSGKRNSRYAVYDPQLGNPNFQAAFRNNGVGLSR